MDDCADDFYRGLINAAELSKRLKLGMSGHRERFMARVVPLVPLQPDLAVQHHLVRRGNSHVFYTPPPAPPPSVPWYIELQPTCGCPNLPLALSNGALL